MHRRVTLYLIAILAMGSCMPTPTKRCPKDQPLPSSMRVKKAVGSMKLLVVADSTTKEELTGLLNLLSCKHPSVREFSGSPVYVFLERDSDKATGESYWHWRDLTRRRLFVEAVQAYYLNIEEGGPPGDVELGIIGHPAVRHEVLFKHGATADNFLKDMAALLDR